MVSGGVLAVEPRRTETGPDARAPARAVRRGAGPRKNHTLGTAFVAPSCFWSAATPLAALYAENTYGKAVNTSITNAVRGPQIALRTPSSTRRSTNPTVRQQTSSTTATIPHLNAALCPARHAASLAGVGPSLVPTHPFLGSTPVEARRAQQNATAPSTMQQTVSTTKSVMTRSPHVKQRQNPSGPGSQGPCRGAAFLPHPQQSQKPRGLCKASFHETHSQGLNHDHSSWSKHPPWVLRTSPHDPTDQAYL
ncbi:hypothetical protein HMPREF0682_1654 [Propionibacterium acidifaciens F0233]|uniref:Uncharacterized protein n=1 Tax=Propionibacterium acidifaciens F0233 TaxID=553198 RepID=U2PY61_9ACTN|nr:hypothetical protein HMPREF0682_1654 [Propionibacterium acidifaciens F0233]